MWFLFQPLVFPIGIFGLFVLPFALRAILSGRLERERVIDIPFVAIHSADLVAHGPHSIRCASA